MTDSIEERLSRVQDWINRPNNHIRQRYPQLMPPETGAVANRVDIAERSFFLSPSSRLSQYGPFRKVAKYLFTVRRLLTLLQVQNDVNQSILEHFRLQEAEDFSTLLRLDVLESANTAQFFMQDVLIKGLQESIKMLSQDGVWRGTISFAHYTNLDPALSQYDVTQVELLHADSTSLHLFVANGIPWIGAAAKHIELARKFLEEEGKLALLIPTFDVCQDIARNFGFVTDTKLLQVDGFPICLMMLSRRQHSYENRN